MGGVSYEGPVISKFCYRPEMFSPSSGRHALVFSNNSVVMYVFYFEAPPARVVLLQTQMGAVIYL